jgi:hypothetical protein
LGSRLTGEQVEFFHREGYLIFDQPVFSQAKFDALKQRFEAKLRYWNEVGGLGPEEMESPHMADPTLFDWLASDEVLDLLEPVMGPDIALLFSHFLCKPPGVGKRAPWHEDSAYFEQILQPMQLVTVWLALDPSTTENGCMRVIPRSHHHGFSQYEPVADQHASVFKKEIKLGEVDESKAVDLVLEPNQCSLHHVKLIHGSNANTSNLRRTGYIPRYFPTTTRFVADDRHPAYLPYLMRGEDRAGNEFADPTVVNQPWLDAHPQYKQRYEPAGESRT